jgi:hypothetical protein
MPNNCHLLDPTYFSLPTTFTGHYNGIMVWTLISIIHEIFMGNLILEVFCIRIILEKNPERKG